MAIYRGPGGSGDAVNDSSSETRLAVEARDAALAAQAAAEAAQAAAETAETNAQTAETNAETAETNAETAATNAASSASSASSSASAASTSATSAASSASSASTSATNAASSASSASTSASNASTSATNAASSASSASSSATSAASSASSASTSASTATTKASEASTSATNAASSASSASSSASTATTQAGIATTKASEASTSATNAASSASSASTSATNAASSASSASTSATNASNSATAASSAQSAAEAARDAALSAYDNFDDRYLGPKASDPTLDNDGNALVSGALYFNTTTNVMKVYTGSSWVAAYVSAAGVLLSVNNLSDLNSVSTARTNLGVTATGSDTTYAYRANNLSDLASASTARTNLGLGTAATTAATDYATAAQGAKADTALQSADIGVSVQGYDADLGAIAALSGTSGLLKKTAANTWSLDTTAYLSGTVGVANGGTGLTSLTAGYIPFGAGTSAFGNSANLFWDNTNARLGVGTSSPAVRFHVSGGNGIIDNATSAYLRVAETSTGNSNRAVVLADSTGMNLIADYGTSAIPMVFKTSNTERLRIDTSGNVGIGTSSPSYLLDVNGTGRINGMPFTSSGAVRLISTHSNSGAMRLVGGADNTASSYIDITGSTYNASSPYITFNNNGAERLRIDSSGNLGLGVTPSAWGGFRAMDFAGYGAIASYTVSGYSTGLYANTYYNGTNYIYKTTNSAMYTDIGSSGFRWFTAPSGTAGNAITFTQAMTLDASGRLGIGSSSTSPAVPLDVTGSAYLRSGGSSVSLQFGPTVGTGDAGIYYDVSGSFSVNSRTSYPLLLSALGSTYTAFNTNGSERMRIDGSGNVGIGLTPSTTQGEKLQVAGSILALNTAGQNQIVMNSAGSNWGVISNPSNDTWALGYTISSTPGTTLGTSVLTWNASGKVSDTKGDIRAIPQNSQTAAYVLVAGDNGKHISITTGGVTVNASVFSVGDVVTIFNNSGSNQTITQGTSVTMRQAGTANTGNRTLAQYGVATILCVVGGATPTFVISGAGLT